MKKCVIFFLSIMLSITVFSTTCSAEQTRYYGEKTLLKAFEIYNNGTEEEWQIFFDDYLYVAGAPNSTPLNSEECEKFRKTENYFFLYRTVILNRQRAKVTIPTISIFILLLTTEVNIHFIAMLMTEPYIL